MSQPEAWTIGRLLQWTADFLKQKGSGSPRLDAEVLLAHARGCQRIELYTAFHEEPAEEVRQQFRDLVKRRAEGTPVAYLVGKREFYSLDFQVTPAVLIPRPETEQIVISVLDLIKAQPSWHSQVEVVDVGTGSGAIAISIAKHVPQAALTALDISPAALEVARENAASHQVAERIEFLVSDLFAALPGDAHFDIIASNPPYVTEAEMRTTAAEAARHEPSLALKAGPDGLGVIGPLLTQAAERLRPGGWLVMELSPTIADAVMARIASDTRYGSAELLRDLSGQHRIVKVPRSSQAA